MNAAEFTGSKREDIGEYILRRPRVVRQENGNGEADMLPEEARPFCWEKKLTVSTQMSAPEIDNYYGIIVTKGEGALKGDFEDTPIRRGLGVLIPACLDKVDVVNTGSEPLEAFCCFPPKSS